MVINDDERKIRAYYSGFPGCSHDNRVWKAMDQYQRPELYFSDIEYLLCDTAFEPSHHAVPAYKCQPGFLQDPDKKRFNTALASPRVISEHVMGMWKGRFPWLRKIRMIITNDSKSLKKILKYIDASIVLHNMLIELGEDIEFDGDMLSDIDDKQRIPEERVLDLLVPNGAPKGTRRDQLKKLVRERYVPRSNYRPLRSDVGTVGEDVFMGVG